MFGQYIPDNQNYKNYIRSSNAYQPSAVAVINAEPSSSSCCTCQQGPVGPQGPPGADGPTGDNGKIGKDGIPGKDGQVRFAINFCIKTSFFSISIHDFFFRYYCLLLHLLSHV